MIHIFDNYFLHEDGINIFELKNAEYFHIGHYSQEILKIDEPIILTEDQNQKIISFFKLIQEKRKHYADFTRRMEIAIKETEDYLNKLTPEERRSILDEE